MSGVPERLAAALTDRYRIEREFGQGGMATVHLVAVDPPSIRRAVEFFPAVT